MTTTGQSPQDDERRLQSLFDATSEQLTQEQLNRMARAAAQIPEAVPAGWLAGLLRLLRRPAFIATALAACALLAFAYFGGRDESLVGPGPPLALTSAEPERPVAPEAPQPLDEDDDIEQILAAIDFSDDLDDDQMDDPLAALHMGPGVEHPMDALQLLFAPDDEESLELLGEVYGALLEGG